MTQPVQTETTQTTKVPSDLELHKEIEALKTEINTLKTKTSFVEKLKSVDVEIVGDLNNQIGKFIIGYGNNNTNRPAGAKDGYFINIPHVWSSLKNTYNKQIFLPRSPNEIWVRNQENGVFDNWTKI